MTGTPPAAGKPTPRRTVSIAAPVGEGAIDSFVRQKGRGFILAFYTALRSIKLYPLENSAVQKALADLAALTHEFVSSEHELDVRVSGEFVFVNATRLRLDLDNYASFSHVLSVFRVCGVGTMHVASAVSARDWQVFLTLVQVVPIADPHDRLPEIVAKLDAANVHGITLTPPPEEDGEDRERDAVHV